MQVPVHQHGSHTQGPAPTPAVPGWFHLHRQAVVLRLFSGIQVCSDTDQWGQWTEFIQKHSRHLCDPNPQISPQPRKRKVDAYSLYLQPLPCIRWEGILILILSVEASLNTWNWWLKAGQGQPWEQGRRSSFGAGGSNSLVRSPLFLTGKPHPPLQGNLSEMFLDSFCQVGRICRSHLLSQDDCPPFS